MAAGCILEERAHGGIIMWNDLSSPWQRSLELAWEAYRSRTIPIGAIIVNKSGQIIAEGRNHIFDRDVNNPLSGTNMAHAEMSAMMKLKNDEHPHIREYTLYTTMEPCPMCFGTMLMMHICSLRYGAGDGFAGATALKDKMDYTTRKRMDIVHEAGDMEAFQLMLQVSFECKRKHPRMEEIFAAWSRTNPESVEAGRSLYKENYFGNAMAEEKYIGKVYDEILSRYGAYKAGI